MAGWLVEWLLYARIAFIYVHVLYINCIYCRMVSCIGNKLSTSFSLSLSMPVWVYRVLRSGESFAEVMAQRKRQSLGEAGTAK